MNEKIVDALIKKDATTFKKEVEKTLYTKMAVALHEKYKEVGRNMFKKKNKDQK